MGAKRRPGIHEHGLVVRLVDAKAGAGTLFCYSESDADGSYGQEKAIEEAPLRGGVRYWVDIKAVSESD